MSLDKAYSEFNLPYNQSSHYWLAIFAPGASDELNKALEAHGLTALPLCSYCFAMPLGYPWNGTWKAISDLIRQHEAAERVQAALLAGEEKPNLEDFEFARRSIASIDMLAESLWLGDAMIEDRVVSYMQPVLDKRSKVFGYEAFARVEAEKEVIGGGRILAAAKGLSAEYMLDRHLHVKAVTSFITNDLEGFLFINFIPGFIHRPEKYLVGLAEAAKFHGMPAKQIVLDFTHSESANDYVHMKAIFDYCRSRGFSFSLDDISSVAILTRIMEAVRPDFIKLDVELVRDAQGVAQQRVIHELVAIAHGAGATVLAEGVETDAIHQELIKADVDLFQGYLFSPPAAITSLKKAAG